MDSFTLRGSFSLGGIEMYSILLCVKTEKMHGRRVSHTAVITVQSVNVQSDSTCDTHASRFKLNSSISLISSFSAIFFGFILIIKTAGYALIE